MNHYVVVLEWVSEGENGINVLGVTHSLEEAKEIFNDTVEEEKNMAGESCWKVYEDTDVEFDAGEDGCYSHNHSRLFIQGVM